MPFQSPYMPLLKIYSSGEGTQSCQYFKIINCTKISRHVSPLENKANTKTTMVDLQYRPSFTSGKQLPEMNFSSLF